MFDRSRYREVSLDTQEAVHFAPPPEHGERIDLRTGAVIAALPGTTTPCDGDLNYKGLHDAECRCLGSGYLVVRESTIEPVDPVDDSLDALHEALAARDEANAPAVDPYLGDSMAGIMKRDVARGASSGTGRRTAKLDPKRVKAFDPPPSVTDGRVERRGRPPRFDGQKREAKLRPSIAAETAALLKAKNDDLAHIAEMILALPESAEILAPMRAKAKSAKAA